jgi:quinol monooxygenase YgiN
MLTREEAPMDRIHAVSLFPSIPPSALDEFKHILSELKTLIESETGTLEWQWFLSADETQCITFESFADSTAVLTHIEGAGGRGARLVERAGGLRLEVLGDTSDELSAALADWGASVFAYGQGK